MLVVVGLAIGGLTGCSGSGAGGGTSTGTADTTQPELLRTEFGRLVDVYGLHVTPQGSTIDLYQKDVVIGSDIQDERGSADSTSDSEITYDFIGADPDTLQPRLFIPRDITGESFKSAFAALDDNLREVSPMLFGTGGAGLPFSVVPRNAAIRLTFSAPLGVDESFFVERAASGQITGLRNTEAVQLLRILGDPAQPGAFVPVPVRVVVAGRTLVLDPVLLGTEGLQYQTTNNAAGLPASPNQLGANLRIAVALDGPLAIPGLRESASTGLTGANNSQRKSIVRDFRSGNSADNSADLTRGFVRDPLPLRVVGELTMYLERVEDVNAFTQEITLFKNGIVHDIDRGDVVRVIADASGIPFGTGEIVIDPEDDHRQPVVQHVRVRIRRIPNLSAIDPRNLPGYPANLAEREAWLVTNAPKAVCIAEFEAGGRIENGVTVGDDPRNFLSFTPKPQLGSNGSIPAPNEFVSPHAGAVVRFTKPVDMATVRWADTFFFAMRDLATTDSIADFIANRPNSSGGLGMDPGFFNLAKYRTPFLIPARVADEDRSQTALRLQPTIGFYLDDTMRNPPAGADYRYFLHLLASSADGGIRDLAGNPLDLQGDTADRSSSVVIPFTVDTRMNGNVPAFEDNLAVSLVRRYASRDEDAQPSYFMPDEVPPPDTSIALGYPLEDIVGGFIYLDGKLVARPTTRSRLVADNINQSPVGQQGTPLAWCPVSISGMNQNASQSASNVVNAGIQNPLNPYGCRLQTVWREVDLSLSRTDAFDFNLDIEQMYWAPYTGTILSYDEFDRVSLFLGHSEYRPAPCVGAFSSLASLPTSGLRTTTGGFQKNFVWNPAPSGNGTVIESQPAPVAAYVDKPMTIDPARVIYEPNGVNRFLPLPTFQKPYFVFRDETVVQQGGDSGRLSDLTATGGYVPYIISPFANGMGRRWTDGPAGVRFANSFWNDSTNASLTGGGDSFTGGLVGSVALPLLADFWTYCDRSDLPLGNGYIAFGTNGWQVAVTVQSQADPFFRVLSAGRAPIGTSAAICRAPGDSQWVTPSGGFVTVPVPGAGPAGDNTFYWIMIDVLKRQSVITSGFVDLNNPHRVPEGFADPRLGPFYLQAGQSTRPADVSPLFAYEFDPPLQNLPAGTSVVPQFRAASSLDATPWYWDRWVNTTSGLGPNPAWSAAERDQLRPTAANFPLDPYKAGDAHIRKWDTRPIPGVGTARNWWTYFYNRTVTSYVEDPNELVNPSFTDQFGVANEPFTPRDVRYVNWRFVTSNNADANPPVSPTIETFALSYRFRRTQ